MSNELIKVMIVDDEQLTRRLLAKCIDWAEFGMTIVGEANGSNELLEQLEQEIPDVVFMDICMPQMDGLELSQIVITKFPHIKIVILTGHDQFEYAQRSVKVGVADFILKPIAAEEIKKVASKLRAKIDSERNQQNAYEELKKQLEEHRPFFIEKFFNQLILNELGDHDEILNKAAYYHLEIKETLFQIAVIEYDSQGAIEHDIEGRLILGLQYLDLIREYFAKNLLVYSFFDYQQRIVILNNDPGIELTEACGYIKRLILDRIMGNIVIGIDTSYSTFKDIHHSYKEACYALQYKIINGKNQLINYDLLHFSNDTDWRFQNEQIELLEFYIKTDMSEKAIELMEDFYATISQNAHISLAQIRMVAFNILLVVLNVLTEQGIIIADVFDKQLQPFEEILRLDTLPEIITYLKSVLITAIINIHQLQKKKISKLIQEIRSYLLMNFCDCTLSVAGVAQKFNLNQNYLSRLFKQEVGQSFKEVLTELRMEKAIKLLQETDLKVYQIAEQIGIEDPHYFSIWFKKYHGMSVNDFRRINFPSQK